MVRGHYQVGQNSHLFPGCVCLEPLFSLQQQKKYQMVRPGGVLWTGRKFLMISTIAAITHVTLLTIILAKWFVCSELNDPHIQNSSKKTFPVNLCSENLLFRSRLPLPSSDKALPCWLFVNLQQLMVSGCQTAGSEPCPPLESLYTRSWLWRRAAAMTTYGSRTGETRCQSADSSTVC